jgi:hypothetical protein
MSDMDKLIALYPDNFTGETMIIPDPTPEQQAADKALMNRLETLAAPLVAWLRENKWPCTSIHITYDRVDVEEHVMGIPFPYSEK